MALRAGPLGPRSAGARDRGCRAAWLTRTGAHGRILVVRHGAPVGHRRAHPNDRTRRPRLRAPSRRATRSAKSDGEEASRRAPRHHRDHKTRRRSRNLIPKVCTFRHRSSTITPSIPSRPRSPRVLPWTPDGDSAAASTWPSLTSHIATGRVRCHPATVPPRSKRVAPHVPKGWWTGDAAVTGHPGTIHSVTSTDAGAPNQLTYQPSLDGLRALAVAAVVLFHLHETGLTGGFLGVDTFFVLSGFLITTLLVLEWRRRDHIGLLAFWARRARRLLPALILLLIVVAIYAKLEAPDLGTPPIALGWHRRIVLRRQLAVRGVAPVVLRVVQRGIAVSPPVVVGDRRAVLPGVAARDRGMSHPRTRPTPLVGVDGRTRHHRVDHRDGRVVQRRRSLPLRTTAPTRMRTRSSSARCSRSSSSTCRPRPHDASGRSTSPESSRWPDSSPRLPSPTRRALGCTAVVRSSSH